MLHRLFSPLLVLIVLITFSFVSFAQEVASSAPPDQNQLIRALQSGIPIVIAGAIIYTLIWISKLPVLGSQWERIPIKYRPVVVIAIGVVGCVAQAMMTKQPWVPALVTGFMNGVMSGAGAITADQIQSKLRAPKQDGGV